MSSEASGASSGTSKKASRDLRDGSGTDLMDVFGEFLGEKWSKYGENVVKNHQLINEIQ